MQKPAMGIPIIVITIFLFMTGYVHFVVNGTSQPEASPAPPAANIQAPAAAAPLKEVTPGKSSGPAQSAIPAGNEIKSWTGRFAGTIDNNLMVIYVGDEAKTFLSSPELNGANLTKGDNVSFDFYYDKNGQPVLAAIKKLVPLK